MFLCLLKVVLDFHDILKSVTSGYASFDYHDDGFHVSPLTKVTHLDFKYTINQTLFAIESRATQEMQFGHVSRSKSHTDCALKIQKLSIT